MKLEEIAFVRRSVVCYDTAPTFVSKVLGHLSLFALFAFFAMNMFKFVPIRGRLKRFAAYTMIGLPIAALTEFVQYFIPGRISRVEDIMIDMLGFYFGTLMILLYRAVLCEIKDEEQIPLYEILLEGEDTADKEEKSEEIIEPIAEIEE